MRFLNSDRVLLLSGLISSVSSIVSGLASLTIVQKVRQTQSSSAIPRPLVLSSAVSNALWTTCGLMIWDMWITVPSSLGLLVNVFLLSLVKKYPGRDAATVTSQWDAAKGKGLPKL